MTPLKFEFDKDEDLCIWKAKDPRVIITQADVPRLMKELNLLLNDDIPSIKFRREKYGTFKIERSKDKFKLVSCHT